VKAPAGLWGRVDLPVTVNVALPGTEVRLSTHLSVGSSFLRDWVVAGRFPNKSGNGADTESYPPEKRVDLAAEYEGIGGEVGWKPLQLSDNWLQLRTLFGVTKEAGVAYAVARVEARRETPVVLRLGSGPGVSLIFNGQRVWSAASMRVAVDAERVPLTLQAGTNVFLFKLCSPNGDRRLTAEITPATGDFGGEVVPVTAKTAWK